MKNGEWKMENSNFSFLNFPFSIVLMFLLLAACSNNKHAEHTDTYTCPMHPTVISDKPATCPVCGMDLVRKAQEGEEVKITKDIAKLLKSTNETVIASIKTTKPTYTSKQFTIDVSGIVTYDRRMVYTIPAKASGRLEKVYLKYAYQPIAKGQKIAAMYSPELVTAQRELLFLLANDASNVALIESSKSKLALLGMTTSQINTVVSKKEAMNTIAMVSDYSGYVIQNNQQAPSMTTTSVNNSQPTGMNSMGGTSLSSTSTAENSPSVSNEMIREGSYVSSGQTLFTIVNTLSLRVELNLPVAQAGSFKKGDSIELDFGNNLKEKAVIDFVQPFFSEGEEFLKLRIITKKLKDVRIGQLVSATVSVQSAEAYWIPTDAVFDSGNEQIVFVKERGVFNPRQISTGMKTNGWVEVIKGLLSSDEFASQASYLIDSESFVKTK